MFNSPNKSVGVINGVPDFPADGNDYVFQGDNTWKVLPPSPGKNLIINGAMNVAQRGTQNTGVTSNGYYTCDRWDANFNTVGTWTLDQSTDAPEGFANSLKATCTTVGSNPMYAQLRQVLEGQNLQHLKYANANAKPMTLSFWVKSNKTGTASFGLVRSRSGTMRHITKGYEIPSANTWHYITIDIPGDTSGDLITNDNSGELEINFWIHSGSEYTGGSHSSWSNYVKANANASNLGVGGAVNDYFAITGVQLEVGDQATEFEYEDYGTTLAKCQRYYYKEEKPYRMYGYKRHDNFMYFDAYSPVPLRGVPTIQKLNNGYLANYQNTFTGVQTGFLARAFTGSRFTIECSTTYTGTHEIVPVWQDSILTFDSEL